ncbi:PPOX class F420-dependent oxidoreductase [Pseudonocardia acidicola]|uniref:PPOX class F420-dependent oxidoreductase n=1 Tax=Pseudonocardia acidicola TaxID=2724939 RepID=A0ABX1SHN6_9PSEU|nr:PPOX class F420-dependent oxidoreductase [Pseudonocardia acidicola]NMI00298.1 PPOX class F420-dependent oxidoreductase [Pseudonocardia acidicola]
MDLPPGLLELLRRSSPCYLATSMPDGSPQLTQTWVDTDGEHILINSVAGYQKIRNIERDPRVALTVSDPTDPARYFAVRGHVLDVTTDGAVDHIEKLAQRYLGGPYPWYGGRDQTRLLITVEADTISSTGWTTAPSAEDEPVTTSRGSSPT